MPQLYTFEDLASYSDGIEAVVERCEKGIDAIKGMISFWQRLQKAELQYAQQLDQLCESSAAKLGDNSVLSKVLAGFLSGVAALGNNSEPDASSTKDEHGAEEMDRDEVETELLRSWKRMREHLRAMAEQHRSVADHYAENIQIGLRRWMEESEAKRVHALGEGKEMSNRWKQCAKSARQAQERYYAKCKEASEATAKLRKANKLNDAGGGNNARERAKRLAVAVHKLEEEREHALNFYIEALNVINRIQHRFSSEAMPNVLLQLEELDGTQSAAVATSIDAFVGKQRQWIKVIDAECTRTEEQLARVDHARDVHRFARLATRDCRQRHEQRLKLDSAADGQELLLMLASEKGKKKGKSNLIYSVEWTSNLPFVPFDATDQKERDDALTRLDVFGERDAKILKAAKKRARRRAERADRAKERGEKGTYGEVRGVVLASPRSALTKTKTRKQSKKEKKEESEEEEKVSKEKRKSGKKEEKRKSGKGREREREEESAPDESEEPASATDQTTERKREKERENESESESSEESDESESESEESSEESSGESESSEEESDSSESEEESAEGAERVRREKEKEGEVERRRKEEEKEKEVERKKREEEKRTKEIRKKETRLESAKASTTAASPKQASTIPSESSRVSAPQSTQISATSSSLNMGGAVANARARFEAAASAPAPPAASEAKAAALRPSPPPSRSHSHNVAHPPTRQQRTPTRSVSPSTQRRPLPNNARRAAPRSAPVPRRTLPRPTRVSDEFSAPIHTKRGVPRSVPPVARRQAPAAVGQLGAPPRAKEAPVPVTSPSASTVTSTSTATKSASSLPQVPRPTPVATTAAKSTPAQSTPAAVAAPTPTSALVSALSDVSTTPPNSASIVTASCAVSSQPSVPSDMPIEYVPNDDEAVQRALMELVVLATDNDYYELFGVDEDACRATIAKRRRELARTLHPDHAISASDTKGAELLSLMNEVWSNVLSKEEKRDIYDRLCAYREQYKFLCDPAQDLTKIRFAARNLHTLRSDMKKKGMPRPLMKEVRMAIDLIELVHGAENIQ